MFWSSHRRYGVSLSLKHVVLSIAPEAHQVTLLYGDLVKCGPWLQLHMQEECGTDPLFTNIGIGQVCFLYSVEVVVKILDSFSYAAPKQGFEIS